MSGNKEFKDKTAIYHQIQKNGDIYVFERTIRYDPEKKYNRHVSSKLIGKILKGTTEMVPTRPRRKSSEMPKADSSCAARKHVGATDILDWVGRSSGLDEDLLACLDPGDARKVQTIARYWNACAGNTLAHFDKWQMMHPTPFDGIISEKMYHDLFEYIGTHENLIQDFFRKRAARIGNNPAVAFDSTTISTYSRYQIEARRGYNKAGDGLDTIKLLTLFDLKTRQPIAYGKQPGNIPDVISIQNVIKQFEWLNLDGVQMVTDNGYYSASNMCRFLRAHMKFLTLAEPTITWVKKIIEEKQSDLESLNTVCPWDTTISGITVRTNQDFEFTRERTRNGIDAGSVITENHRVYVHIFHSDVRAAEQRQAFVNRIMELKKQVEAKEELSKAGEKLAETYLIVTDRGTTRKVTINDEAVRSDKKFYGYFVLVGNKAIDTFEALRLYRLREKIEECFRADKNNFDADKPRVWSPDVLRGRMFCQFVAMCYYFHLREAIRHVRDMNLGQPNGDDVHDLAENLKIETTLKNWLSQKSMGQILDWFDCVELTTINNGTAKIRITTEMVRRDKLFLKLLTQGALGD